MASSSPRKTLSDPAAVFPQESSDRLLELLREEYGRSIDLLGLPTWEEDGKPRRSSGRASDGLVLARQVRRD